MGDAASGWRLSTGSDVRLRTPGNGSVVYHGPNGLTGTFTPDGSGGFTAPAGFKMTLTATSGGGWALYDHGSGDTRHFNASGWLTELADRNGNAVVFGYEADGSLTSITTDVGTPGASTLRVATEGSGRGRITSIAQTTDGYDGVTRSVALSYDANGYLASLTDAAGRVTEFFHGAYGNLNRITAPGGTATELRYDELGRVQMITQPTADAAVEAVTTLKYEPERTLVTDPNGNRTTYGLTGDGWELVAKATDPAGHVRSATYTPFLDVATATDPAGTATFGYDEQVNGGESLTSATSAVGVGSAFAYGNTAAATRYQPTSATDGQDNTSAFTYNGAGNRLSATDAASAQASVTYHGDGTVATSTSPSGAVTSYGYDGVGQLISITPPADSTLEQRSISWDGFGRPASRTDGRGITESYTYDHLDRITSVAWSDGTPTVTYTYEAKGTVDTRTDASGTTDYGHDPLGRLSSRTHTTSPGAAVSYAYDKAGNLVSATNVAGTTSYRYDARNLVREMTGPDGRLIGFAHDAAGRRTDTWFATNSARSSWAAHTRTDYDDSGRIARTWTSTSDPYAAGSDATRVFDTTYSYADDPNGGLCATARAGYPNSELRWAAKDNLTGVWANYCYDDANRLTIASRDGAGAVSYTYDAGSNRTGVAHNGTAQQSLSFNAGDQIITLGYRFDAAGNTLADSHGAYTYNGAGQLTGFTDSDSTGAYTFAGTDQTELITDTRGRTYTYGRTDATGLPLIESYTDGGATFGYLHDPQGTPLAITGANTHYLALDGLGSVVAAINHSGTQTAAYTCDPWGQATATGVNGSGIVHYQLFGYAGGVTDHDTGLVRFGQRWYDPVVGRFTQQDALETLADPRRANRYEYANSNPINYVDPTGEVSVLEGVLLGVAAVSIVATGIGIAGAVGAAAAGTSTVAAEAGLAAGILATAVDTAAAVGCTFSDEC